jgi:hypothetical protein
MTTGSRSVDGDLRFPDAASRETVRPTVGLRQAVQIEVSPGRNCVGMASTGYASDWSLSLHDHSQDQDEYHARGDDYGQRATTPR